jgi:photosynthetic reaction center H subunit
MHTGTGALTGYLDVAQVVLYAFWAFFAGLIYYLRREDKREGYPLISDRSDRVTVQGFPPIPRPKTFRLPHGGTVQAPRRDGRTEPPIHAKPVASFPGAPLQPTGNPMRDAVGPASYAEREDKPEFTIDGLPLIVPLRVAVDAYVAPEDPDPRGMAVFGADGKLAGTVQDIWVDRSEPQVRYLEVALAGGTGKTVLLPITMALVRGDKRRVEVNAILASQFAEAPTVKNPDQVTKLEEDRITAYFASGYLYATRERSEPLL